MNSLTSNFFFNLLYQVLLYAVPLITTPYLSRVLGAEEIGRYSFAQSIVSYFVLAATLGTSLYGQRRIASLKGKTEKKSEAFSQIVGTRLITTLIALSIYGIAVVPNCSDSLLYIVASVEIIGVCTDISWFFQGEENFGTITKCSGFFKLLSIVLIFLFVRQNSDLNIYVAIYCTTIVIGNLSQWAFVPKYVHRNFHLSLKSSIVVLKPAALLFISQVAIQIYTVLDKTMIGLITRSDAQNGYYEQAQKLIKVLTALCTSIGTVMASRIAILWKEQKTEEIQEMILYSFRIVMSIAFPIMFGIILIASRFVPIFYGEGYGSVIPLLYVLVLLVGVIGSSNIIGIQYLVPTGKENYLTISVTVGSVVNLIMNSILIGKYQALGAAIASVVAECCVTGTQFYLVRKELRLMPIGKISIRYFIYCIPMFIVGKYFDSVMPEGLMGMIGIIIPCIFVYVAFLLIFKDPVLKLLTRKNEELKK